MNSEQALELAKECGAMHIDPESDLGAVCFYPCELDAFAEKIRRLALCEALETLKNTGNIDWLRDKLHRMISE